MDHRLCGAGAKLIRAPGRPKPPRWEMFRAVVVFRKPVGSGGLSNARVQRRAARRDPCHARGVTCERVRWNGLFGGLCA